MNLPMQASSVSRQLTEVDWASVALPGVGGGVTPSCCGGGGGSECGAFGYKCSCPDGSSTCCPLTSGCDCFGVLGGGGGARCMSGGGVGPQVVHF